MQIVFTCHGHRDISKDGGMLAKWWGDCIMYGTQEWELMPDLKLEKQDLLIDKNRYSVFFNTKFDEKLRSQGINELIITGVMTKRVPGRQRHDWQYFLLIWLHYLPF